MKVAVVSPDDLSSVLFCKEMIELLKHEYQCEVTVMGDIYDKSGCHVETLRSWDVEFVPIRVERYIDPIADIRFLMSLHRFFKKKAFHAVITNCTKPNIYGPLAARQAGIKNTLSSFWGKGSAFVETGQLINGIARLTLLGLYWLSFNASSRVWFTNYIDCEYFKRLGILRNSKAIISNNYVNTDDYRPRILLPEKAAQLRQELGMREGDAIVIMVGRLVWAKGVREFVEAAKLLKERLPFVKFVFVGPKDEGAIDAVPVAYLRESERDGNFLWTGFRNDVNDLYALAELAVLPSYYKEGGFPRGLTEPMSMGKPIIGADTPECRGPVEHGKNGYLVPIRDPRALANAIESLMLDNKKRGEFGRYSREKAVRDLDEKMIVGRVLREFMGSLA